MGTCIGPVEVVLVVLEVILVELDDVVLDVVIGEEVDKLLRLLLEENEVDGIVLEEIILD